jgi:hypothetical protein
MARNSEGSIRVWVLNVLEKWFWSEKPAARAISTREASVVESCREAYSMRIDKSGAQQLGHLLQPSRRTAISAAQGAS